jgi:hypothetical protein
MLSNLPRYMSGGEVHVGDRVRYQGTACSVVGVSDGLDGEFAPGYEDHLGCDAGILVSDDDGDLTFISEANEDLEFVRHASDAFLSLGTMPASSSALGNPMPGTQPPLI